DGGAAVGAVEPGTARPPGELGGLRRGAERLSRRHQRAGVDAVVDRLGHGGHVFSPVLSETDGAAGPRTTGSVVRPRRTSLCACVQLSELRGTASRSDGKRAGSAVKAMRASNRASDAPRQKWTPCPKPRCGCGERVTSSTSPPAYTPGSWLAAPRQTST